MTRGARRIGTGLRVAAVAAAVAAGPARAQEWRAGAQVGRVAYDGAPAGTTSTSTLALGLTRTDVSDAFALSVGVPVGDDPAWGVAAARKRFEAGVRLGALLDLSAHAFLQRDLRAEDGATSSGGLLSTPDPLDPAAQPSRSGQGGGGEAAVGAFGALGRFRLEARAGAAAQASAVAGVRQERVLPLADARLSIAMRPIVVTAEARGWAADEGRHVYAGLTAQLARGPLVLWASTGRWVDGGVDAIPWAGGARLALGDRVALEVSARGNAFDPLYQRETGLTVAAGTSIRLGGRAAPLPERAPVPAAYAGGRATIRLRASDAAGRPAIAGDFTGWRPEPMQRDGDAWTFAAPIAPGVYHYAFVAEDGTWFVPETTPGRQSDGMGGQVAVLVVSP